MSEHASRVIHEWLAALRSPHTGPTYRAWCQRRIMSWLLNSAKERL